MENRRSFLCKILMVNAGAVLAPSLTFGGETVPSVNSSKTIGGILPVGVLIGTFEALCKDESLADYKELINLDLTERWLPGNYSFSGFAIAQYKGNEAELIHAVKKLKEDDTDKSKRAVSMLLGKVVYDAVNQVYSEKVLRGKNLILLEAYLMQGKNELSGMSKEQLLQYFNTLLPRMVTRLHTLKPDELEGDEWLVRVSKWRKANLAYVNQLAGAMTIDIKNNQKDEFDILYKKAITMSMKNVKEKILDCKKEGLL